MGKRGYFGLATPTQHTGVSQGEVRLVVVEEGRRVRRGGAPLLGRKLTFWGFQNGMTLENWSIGSKVRYFWKIKKNQIYLKKIAFQFWSGSNMKRNYFWGGSYVEKTGAAWAPTFIVLFWKWICSLRRLLPAFFTGSPRETGLWELAGRTARAGGPKNSNIFVVGPLLFCDQVGVTDSDAHNTQGSAESTAVMKQIKFKGWIMAKLHPYP